MALQRSSASAMQFVRVSDSLLNSSLGMTSGIQMYPKSQSLMSLRQKPNSQSLLDEGNQILRKNFFYLSEMIGVDVIQNSLKLGTSNLAWQIALELDRLQADSTMTTALASVRIGAGNLAITGQSLMYSSPSAARTDTLDVMRLGMWRGKLDCDAYFGRGQISNPRPWTVRVEMVIDNKGVTLKRGDNNYSEILAGSAQNRRGVSFFGQGQHCSKAQRLGYMRGLVRLSKSRNISRVHNGTLQNLMEG
jgi:hypothetical protein